MLVAAHARNRVIGDGGRIPWHLPDDFAHFKRADAGAHAASWAGAPGTRSAGRCPGRTTIVVTRDQAFDPGFEGVLVAHSLEEALALAADLPGDVMVAGGGEIYAAPLPFATHQVLTEVDLDARGRRLLPATSRQTSGWRSAARSATAASGCGSSGWTRPHEPVRRRLLRCPALRAGAGGDPRAGRLRRAPAGPPAAPVRALATSLDLAANTVARAYKELEALGVVETRGRAGTFVAGRGVERSAREAAATYVASVRALGLSDDEALGTVRRALGR